MGFWLLREVGVVTQFGSHIQSTHTTKASSSQFTLSVRIIHFFTLPISHTHQLCWKGKSRCTCEQKGFFCPVWLTGGLCWWLLESEWMPSKAMTAHGHLKTAQSHRNHQQPYRFFISVPSLPYSFSGFSTLLHNPDNIWTSNARIRLTHSSFGPSQTL